MDVLTKCPNCNGKKKVAPLGAIQKDCSFCKGIGYINSDVDEEKNYSSSEGHISVPVKVVKKRGRPPKINDY